MGLSLFRETEALEIKEEVCDGQNSRIANMVANPTDVRGWITSPLCSGLRHMAGGGTQHFHRTRRQVEPSLASTPAGLAVESMVEKTG